MSSLDAVRQPQAWRLAGAPVVEAGSVPGYGAIFNAGVILQDGVVVGSAIVRQIEQDLSGLESMVRALAEGMKK